MEKSRLIKIAPDTEYNKLMLAEQEIFYKKNDVNFSSTYLALDKTLEWVEPTTPRKVFFEIFNKLSLNSKCVFLDCGSGLGHAVYLASFFFKEVYGVEYIDEIAKLSEKNLKQIMPKSVVYKIFCHDLLTLDVDLLNKINVFYLSSPFYEKECFEIFIEKIINSIFIQRREIWIIYYYPHHEDIMIKYTDIFPLDISFQSIGKVNSYHHLGNL
jgi:hypothetical protein